MPDQILKHSRATLKTPSNEQAYSYFENLAEFISEAIPGIDLPIVKIVYSLNKDCETFKYKGQDYIIYDQYLGQAFNKFNRLIFHEDQEEAEAYLCKLLGEQYYLINDHESCLSHMIFHHLNKKAKAYDLPQEFILKKTQLILVQESFVFLHEVTHNIIAQKPNLTQRTKTFLESHDMAKLIMSTVKKELENSPSIGYVNHFIEELTCDIIAFENVFRYYIQNDFFSKKNIVDGIILAFLYLRTLMDIRDKATGEYHTSNNVFRLFSKLRYNLVRHYFESNELVLMDKELSTTIVKSYELWEEKIDVPVVVFLTDELRVKLKKNLQRRDTDFNVVDMAKELVGI